MKRTLFFFGIAAAGLSVRVIADTETLLSWSGRSSHLEYQVASAEITATVRHPFKVIRFSTEQAKGTLSFDPKDIGKGFSLDLALDANAWSCSFQRLNWMWTSLFPEEKNEKILIKSESGRLIDKTVTGNHFALQIFPEIQVRAAKTESPIFSSCDQDGAVIKCNISGAFPLSALNIAVPHYFGVQGKDWVDFKGELAWVPASVPEVKQ